MRQQLFFFFAFVIFISSLTSCAPKTQTQISATQLDSLPKPEEPERIPFCDYFIKGVPVSVLENAQIVSGPDTIELQSRGTISKAVLGSEGKVKFLSFAPVVVVPFTPGKIIKGSIKTDSLGNPTRAQITFWKDEKFFLTFGRSNDQNGTWTLMLNDQTGLVVFGQKNYQLVAGGGPSNPPYLLPEWEEAEPLVAPGVKVGETKPATSPAAATKKPTPATQKPKN